jgi:hypothetical protein
MSLWVGWRAEDTAFRRIRQHHTPYPGFTSSKVPALSMARAADARPVRFGLWPPEQGCMLWRVGYSMAARAFCIS